MSGNGESTRSCGGCTACCKAYTIFELKKPTMQWCTHCVIKKGCNIYDSRPQECRDYQCSWLQGVGEVEERPDKVGIIFDVKAFPGGEYLVFVFEVRPGKLETKYAKDRLNDLRSEGIITFITHENKHQRFSIPVNATPGPAVRKFIDEYRLKFGGLHN